jgi:hypothetical protein
MHWMKKGLRYNRIGFILCADHFFLEEAEHVDHCMQYLHCFQINRYRKLLVHEVWEASTSIQVNYNFLNYMILVSWVSVLTGCRVDDDFNCQWRAVNVIFTSSLRQHYPRAASTRVKCAADQSHPFALKCMELDLQCPTTLVYAFFVMLFCRCGCWKLPEVFWYFVKVFFWGSNLWVK